MTKRSKLLGRIDTENSINILFIKIERKKKYKKWKIQLRGEKKSRRSKEEVKVFFLFILERESARSKK